MKYHVIFAISILMISGAHAFGQDDPTKSLASAVENIKIPSFNGEDIFKYLNDIIIDKTKYTTFYDLIGFSIGMVIYGIFVYHFYRFISKRDLFNWEKKISNVIYTAAGKKASAVPRIIGFIITKLFVFPIVIFIWFTVYSLFMFFLAQKIEQETVFLFSSALIIAVRIAAYYSEDLARDLAKLLPFNLLALFLLNPVFFSIDDIVTRIGQMPHFILQITAFIIVAMVVEMPLSVAYLIKIRFFGHKEKEASDTNHPV